MAAARSFKNNARGLQGEFLRPSLDSLVLVEVEINNFFIIFIKIRFRETFAITLKIIVTLQKNV
jgi:hypothetical protein